MRTSISLYHLSFQQTIWTEFLDILPFCHILHILYKYNIWIRMGSAVSKPVPLNEKASSAEREEARTDVTEQASWESCMPKDNRLSFFPNICS